MKMHFLGSSLMAIVLLLGVSPIRANAAGDTVVRESDDIRYVSGGVGDASLEQLSRRVGEFNLKLVFALKSGEYLADVRVVITDGKGRARVETTAEGPWLLARLPAGEYRVAARHAGKTFEQSVTVGARALRVVSFRWHDE